MMSSLTTDYARPAEVVNFAMARDILETLSKPAKSINAKWLYDARGSELFELITLLPEYYPTRTEASILRRNAPEMITRWPESAVMVEFGSGSSIKTEILLAAAPHLGAYVPIDVSRDALDDAVDRLTARFPKLRIEAITGDFSAAFELPSDLRGKPRIGFFPGSTIGNLTPPQAKILLGKLGRSLGAGSRLIIGFDLRKPLSRLIPAYNDEAGVTAEFNLNLLARINHELGGDFDLEHFAHEAIWNAVEGRVEMHLVSRRAQSVRVLDRVFHFADGERIHTENSYKYTLQGFSDLSIDAGFETMATWTDGEDLFCVRELLYKGR
jgi:L-histidine N-alpha-methyltransferase